MQIDISQVRKVSVDDTVTKSIQQGAGSYLTIYNPTPVTNEEGPKKVDDRKPLILNVLWYLVWSLLGFGWIIRLLIYSKSISLNVFMKKVILR